MKHTMFRMAKQCGRVRVLGFGQGVVDRSSFRHGFVSVELKFDLQRVLTRAQYPNVSAALAYAKSPRRCEFLSAPP
jgi:hypothetical protein